MNRIYGVVCGISGTGKSYLLQNYIIPQLANQKPVIVLDIMDEYDGEIYQGFEHFWNEISQKKQLSKSVHVIKWKKERDAIDTIRFVRILEESVSLVIEESHVLFTDPDLARTVKKPLKEITMFGRHYGIDTILSTQRPGNLSADVRSQAQFFTFFRLKDRTDLDYARSRDPNLVDTIANLEKKQFITSGDLPDALAKLKQEKITQI